MVRGRVHGIQRKPEVDGERGLPKAAVPEAYLGASGLDGDFNRYRHEEKQDDAGMAVLLMPLETLEELNREGWPVRPGDLGENFTTSGIRYADFSPGRRFRVGQAEVEVSKACTPCDNLFQLPYVRNERGPEFLQVMLGRRGWYARVVRAGRVAVGDAIQLLDEPAP